MRSRRLTGNVLLLMVAGAVAVAACGADDDAPASPSAAGEGGSSTGNAAGQGVEPTEGGHESRGGTGGGGGSDLVAGSAGEGEGAAAGVAATGGASAGADAGGGGGGAGGEGAEVDPCATIEPAVRTHVESMREGGWQARNEENGLQMFGCAGADTPRDCLATYPRALGTAYGAGWEGDAPESALRVLRVNAYSSRYTTAVSADGRFVAHGGKGAASGGSTIIDLQENQLIASAAAYDPSFLPDNSGFMIHDSGGSSAGGICALSLLTAGATSVSFHESGCEDLSAIGLNNYLAALLDGSEYLSVHGPFVTDDGGHAPTLQNPAATFSSDAGARLVPFVFDGTSFVASKSTVSVELPMEGDFTISPSGQLLLSRVADGTGAQAGYNLRQLELTPSSNTYTAEALLVAHYCGVGGVPSFSYDERYVAYHRYVTAADALELGFTSAADPSFAEYLTKGASNLYLMDLLTGISRRITRMAPGQYAVSPRFRSDGWLYFMVRVAGTTTEYVVASDAALAAAEP